MSEYENGYYLWRAVALLEAGLICGALLKGAGL